MGLRRHQKTILCKKLKPKPQEKQQRKKVLLNRRKLDSVLRQEELDKQKNYVNEGKRSYLSGDIGRQESGDNERHEKTPRCAEVNSLDRGGGPNDPMMEFFMDRPSAVVGTTAKAAPKPRPKSQMVQRKQPRESDREVPQDNEDGRRRSVEDRSVCGQDRESEHAIEREIGHSCHGAMITVSHQLMLIKHNGPSCILVG